MVCWLVAHLTSLSIVIDWQQFIIIHRHLCLINQAIWCFLQVLSQSISLPAIYANSRQEGTDDSVRIRLRIYTV